MCKDENEKLKKISHDRSACVPFTHDRFISFNYTRKMYNGLNIIRQQQISRKHSAWQRVPSFTKKSGAFFAFLDETILPFLSLLSFPFSFTKFLSFPARYLEKLTQHSMWYHILYYHIFKLLLPHRKRTFNRLSYFYKQCQFKQRFKNYD